MPAYPGDVYEHVGVPGLLAPHPVSGVTAGGPDGLPPLPGPGPCGAGGVGDPSPHAAGTAGALPPVHHGSSCSWPYQLMITSDQPKPCTGQPPNDPDASNGMR